MQMQSFSRMTKREYWFLLFLSENSLTFLLPPFCCIFAYLEALAIDVGNFLFFLIGLFMEAFMNVLQVRALVQKR